MYGPEVRGTLTIGRQRAEIAGRVVPVHRDRGEITFTLPDEGSFRGHLREGRITGHWMQPRGVSLGMPYATPVTLTPVSGGRWRGEVRPVDDTFTFFLPIDGDTLFLQNPERNLGRNLRLQRIGVDGTNVRLYGANDKLVTEGKWDEAGERLSVDFGNRGGWFDFERSAGVEFHPRTNGAYVYRKPSLEADGWSVADAKEAGLDVAAISSFMQTLIDTPMKAGAQQMHAVLIARHGKLVVEEYFHGVDREELHDTRSAAKVLADLLAGAAHVPASTRVKGDITLGHLLSMSSGLDCEDDDPKSAGNEDRMQDEHPDADWAQLTLALPSVRKPGEKAVYCSMSPNLAGAVIAKQSGRWLPDLFRERIAEPLQIRHYALDLTPAGEAYMGGGARLTARDFLKLAQLMLDRGKWHGREVLPAAWVRESLRQRFEMYGNGYGYLWWRTAYPYRGRQVEAFFAGGNGGQIAMGIPGLDLAIVFLGGNYGDPAGLVPQREYVPKFILPAVR
jgi:hypothetical protein